MSQSSRSRQSVATYLIGITQTRTWAILPLWLVCYIAVVLPSASRPMWYDELLTYYGAMAPTFSKFWTGITHFDLNPPLQYALVRASVCTFGDSHFAVRLPSIVAFFGAGFVLFLYERKRSGGAYGLTVFTLLFLSGFLAYATEARPYALELFFVSLAYTSWLGAISADSWGWQHLTLMLSVAGLFLSHCFAPVFIIPLIAAELVRTLQKHRCDWRIFCALSLPLPLAFFELPLVAKPGQIIFDAPATWTTLFVAYGLLLLPFLVPAGLLLGASLFVRKPLAGRWRSSRLSIEEGVLLGSSIAVPVLLILYAIIGKINFHTRYVVGVAVPLSLLIVRFFERLALKSSLAGALGAFLLLINFASHGIEPIPRPGKQLANVPGSIVAANGGRFLELDHYGSKDFVSRLFYVTDRSAAARYAHSTVFEDFGLLKTAYPVRANVLPYSEFVSSHKQFRVISFPNDPQWLISKLRADGASVVTSQGSAWLYEVTMP